MSKDLKNTGHGHVHPRPDGFKARCGGPGICSQCSQEAAAAKQAPTQPRAGYEREKAVMEAHRNVDAEAYFGARHAMLDTIANRRIFEAAFERGWNARIGAEQQAPTHQQSQVGDVPCQGCLSTDCNGECMENL